MKLPFIHIKTDSNSKILFICIAITAMLNAMAYPAVTKFLVSSLPARWLAIEEIVITFSLIVLCRLWNNDTFRNKSIPKFVYIYFTEGLIGSALVFYSAFIDLNPWILAIGFLILTSIISVWLSRIIIAFKSILFKDREREDYDNNHELVYSIAAFVGSVVAIVINPPIRLALIIYGIAILGDVGWIIVYFRNKEKLVHIY